MENKQLNPSFCPVVFGGKLEVLETKEERKERERAQLCTKKLMKFCGTQQSMFMAIIDGLKEALQELDKQKWINESRRIFGQTFKYFVVDTFALKMFSQDGFAGGHKRHSDDNPHQGNYRNGHPEEDEIAFYEPFGDHSMQNDDERTQDTGR